MAIVNMSPMRVVGSIAAKATDPGFRLSDTALRWVASLYDPRQVKEDAWVPYQTAFSQKETYFSRGTFSTGTTGYGFVIATPGISSDVAQVLYTQATSVGGSATTIGAFTNTAGAAVNGTWTNAQYTGTGPANLQSRIVSAALYVKYAGTELNRGGNYVLIEEPNHAALGTYTQVTAQNQSCTHKVPIGEEWVHVNLTPNSVAELNFASTSYGNYPQGYLLGAVVNSAGTPQNFDYEFVIKAEIVGSLARSASASYEDSVGFGCVFGASNMFQQLDSVLGIDGFMNAIHAQMRNQSGHLVSGAPVGNWAGLLPLLPELATLVLPSLAKAGIKLVNSFTGLKASSAAKELSAELLSRKKKKKKQKAQN